MSADFLSAFAATVLSLLFSYVPGIRTWFDALGTFPDGSNDNGARKRLLMLGLLALATAASFLLACSHLAADFGLSLTCTRGSTITLLRAFGLAVIANQATYLISPKPQLTEYSYPSHRRHPAR